jgi:hypothetical protein
MSAVNAGVFPNMSGDFFGYREVMAKDGAKNLFHVGVKLNGLTSF